MRSRLRLVDALPARCAVRTPVAAIKTIILLVVLPVGAACDHALSGEDDRRLDLLRQSFGDAYRFDSHDVYLTATVTADRSPSKQEAQQIVAQFWMNGSEVRRDSRLAYLNLYRSNGQFAFQAYLDPARWRVEFSRTEHY